MNPPTPWEPPTRLDFYCDRASKGLLNVLIVMLLVQSYYTVYFTEPQEYEVIPEHYQGNFYLNKTSLPLITQEDFEKMQEPYMRTELLGMLGIIAYIGLRMTQPWYRERLKKKFEGLSR